MMEKSNNRFPNPAFSNIANSLRSNLKHSSDSGSAHVSVSEKRFNLQHFRLVEFFIMSVSSFTDHVEHIVTKASKKKVVGVATARDVTLMKHADSFRNIPSGQYPSPSVRAMSHFASAYYTISLAVNSSIPNPAVVIRFSKPINFRPESLGKLIKEFVMSYLADSFKMFRRVSGFGFCFHEPHYMVRFCTSATLL